MKNEPKIGRKKYIFSIVYKTKKPNGPVNLRITYVKKIYPDFGLLRNSNKRLI